MSSNDFDVITGPSTATAACRIVPAAPARPVAKPAIQPSASIPAPSQNPPNPADKGEQSS